MIEEEIITRKLMFTSEDLMNKYIEVYKRKGYEIEELGKIDEFNFFFKATCYYNAND